MDERRQDEKRKMKKEKKKKEKKHDMRPLSHESQSENKKETRRYDAAQILKVVRL